MASARQSDRRGSVLIVTMWVIIALTGLVLVLSYHMRVEAVAVANRRAQSQADAAEQGAEQFLLSVVDTEMTTPGSMQSILMEERWIGDCRFWVLKPDPDNKQELHYGMIDEAGKLDLNSASVNMILMFPSMTQDVADCIYDWRTTGDTVANPKTLRT